MGFFSRLFHPREPTNSLPGDNFRFWGGHSASGKMVNERSSMQLTAVYACVRLLSEAIASLPLHMYEVHGDSKTKAIQHPLYAMLHDEPNPEMTSFIFRETLMTHLLLWGNAYAQILRNKAGDIIGLYPLMPQRMRVDRDSSGALYYEYQKMVDDGADMSEGTVQLAPNRVLHIPGLGFDGLVGYSPIAMAKNAIGLSMSAEEFGSKFFANGATPSGILEYPGSLKEETRSKIRQSWVEGYSSDNALRVALLEEGMKYSPISINPNEAQFLETRKFQIDEIARIFRVPPHMIGDLEKSSFSNIENMSREFVTYTLNPWLARWEQALNRSLFTREEKGQYFVKFNVDGLLRGDFKSRMESYAIGINNGFMCPNDVRALEDMDLIPDELGGNKFMVNGTLAPLEDAGAAYQITREEGNQDE